MKLIQDVTSKANNVIQELHNTMTAAEVEKLPRYHPISHFAIKNGRRKMEDRHVIIHDLSTLYGLNVRGVVLSRPRVLRSFFLCIVHTTFVTAIPYMYIFKV